MHDSTAMSRYIHLLGILALLVAPASLAGTLHGQGTLWTVRADNGEMVGHILGTIHSDDPRVLELDPGVKAAFRDSRRYAFELDFDRDIRKQMARAMFDRHPPNLPGQLGPSDWSRAQAQAQARGIPARALRLMKPWALALTLLIPPMEPANSLDRVLFQRAQRLERPTTGLETAQEQIQLFDGLSEPEQLEMLRTALDLNEQGRVGPMFERLTSAWLRGDLAALQAISEDNPMLADDEANDAFERRIVDERNQRMVERMQPLFERGGAFVAIGALHLPGRAGVLHRLEQAGYTVRAVE